MEAWPTQVEGFEVNRDDPQFFLNLHYIEKWHGPQEAFKERIRAECWYHFLHGHWYGQVDGEDLLG